MTEPTGLDRLDPSPAVPGPACAHGYLPFCWICLGHALSAVLLAGLEAEAACTCYLGHRDHSYMCHCTTSIMECTVHGDSRFGQIERELADRYQGEP